MPYACSIKLSDTLPPWKSLTAKAPAAQNTPRQAEGKFVCIPFHREHGADNTASTLLATSCRHDCSHPGGIGNTLGVACPCSASFLRYADSKGTSHLLSETALYEITTNYV